MATKTKKTTRAGKPVRAKKTTAQPSAPRQGKSAFRWTTLVTLLLFIGVVAGAVYMNRRAETAVEEDITPAVEPAFLITSEALVTSIEVKPQKGETISLERNAEFVWVFTQPDTAEADQGLVEAAAAQIVALRVVTPLDDVTDPSIYGLSKPSAVITIAFQGGEISVIEVGDLTPSETGYYVRVGDKYYVAALSGIDALTNLADYPPYMVVEATPTP